MSQRIDIEQARVVLNKLAECGIRFAIDLPTGGLNFATIEAALLFLIDPVVAKEHLMGVTVDECRIWNEQSGYLRCTAKTRKGSRCQNMIDQVYDLPEWARLQKDVLCWHHGEGKR